MLEVIKKLDSATIKGLIVATIPLLVLLGSFFGLDEAIFSATLAAWGEKLVTLVSLGGVAWAAYARLFKATPPLTQTAVEHEAKLIAEGKIKPTANPPAAPASKQGGFFRITMLAVLLAIGAGSVMTIAACVNTTTAIRNAQTPSDYALIFLEGYDSALKGANQLRASGSLVGDNLERVRQAELKAWPLVSKIDPLRVAYERTRSATDAQALQTAIDDAMKEAADFIRTVREMRARS